MCMMAVGLLGAGISAMGAMQQGKAQADAYRKQAAEYQTQSQLDQRQASTEEMTGQYQQRRMTEKAGQLASQQMTSYAASGVTMSGSPTDIILDSRRESQLDIAAIKYNTDLKSDNLVYKSRIDNMNAGSALDAADTAETAGMFGAMSSLVGGFTKLGGAF